MTPHKAGRWRNRERLGGSLPSERGTRRHEGKAPGKAPGPFNLT